jgi:solute carrier family 29 (equilibrative nucleoside transporter), member 1/2/3
MLPNKESLDDDDNGTNDLLNNDSLMSNNIDENIVQIENTQARLIYWACFCQGVGMLFPWNVFITAAAYFSLRFVGTSVERDFEQAFSFSYTFANLIIFLLLLRFGSIPGFNLKKAVVIPNVITAGLFLLAAIFVFTPMSGGVLFALTIISVLLCGSFAACLQAGIFGLTARLPTQFTQAVFGGQGAAGATVSILSLFSSLSAGCTSGKEMKIPTIEDIAPQSFAYFFASSAVVLICMAIFVWLTKTSYVTSQLNEANVLLSPALPSTDASVNTSLGISTTSWWNLLEELKEHCFGVCLTFTVTLCLFPGLAANIQSYHNPYNEQCPPTGILYGFGVWQSFLFLIFNIGDTVGRQLTLLGSAVPPKKVWLISVGRLIFIPLFMTCNLKHIDGNVIASDNKSAVVSGGAGGGSGSYSPSSVSVLSSGSDFWPCLLMLLFAASNGWCAGLEMMNGPKTCKYSQDQSRAGTLLAFFMTLGLLLGSLMSFPVLAIVG